MSTKASSAMRVLLLLAVIELPCIAGSLAAQGRTLAGSGSYPNKPLRFIIPYPAGGATDVLSRILGERLAAQLGQPVVADNRGGAAGRIGLELLAKSPPDGYTISLPSSAVAISATLIPNLPYDPLRDFAPVTLIADIPNLMVTPATLPATTLKEFIALLKAKPGAYHYGSGGIGANNHITAELFQLVAGVRMSHVPYKSSAQALTDVIGNQIQMILIGPPAAAPHVQAGRLRALAIVYKQRYSGMPEVPTTAEAGLAGVDAPNWYGVVTRTGTPNAIVARLNREIVAMLSTDEMKKQLLQFGATPRPQTPGEFAEFMRREVETWAKVIKTANIKPE
jgi:tripartite-type tricarboxylate transporter receptor subunit TctC